jgi:hypothetical protein
MHESDKTYNRVMWCGFGLGMVLLMARLTGIITVTVKFDGPAIAVKAKAPDFLFQAPSEGTQTERVQFVVHVESGSETGLKEAQEVIRGALRTAEASIIRRAVSQNGGTDSPARVLPGMPECDTNPKEFWYLMNEKGVMPWYPVLRKRKVDEARELAL